MKKNLLLSLMFCAVGLKASDSQLTTPRISATIPKTSQVKALVIDGERVHHKPVQAVPLSPSALNTSFSGELPPAPRESSVSVSTPLGLKNSPVESTPGGRLSVRMTPKDWDDFRATTNLFELEESFRAENLKNKNFLRFLADVRKQNRTPLNPTPEIFSVLLSDLIKDEATSYNNFMKHYEKSCDRLKDMQRFLNLARMFNNSKIEIIN